MENMHRMKYLEELQKPYTIKKNLKEAEIVPSLKYIIDTLRAKAVIKLYADGIKRAIDKMEDAEAGKYIKDAIKLVIDQEPPDFNQEDRFITAAYQEMISSQIRLDRAYVTKCMKNSWNKVSDDDFTAKVTEQPYSNDNGCKRLLSYKEKDKDTDKDKEKDKEKDKGIEPYVIIINLNKSETNVEKGKEKRKPDFNNFQQRENNNVDEKQLFNKTKE